MGETTCGGSKRPSKRPSRSASLVTPRRSDEPDMLEQRRAKRRVDHVDATRMVRRPNGPNDVTSHASGSRSSTTARFRSAQHAGGGAPSMFASSERRLQSLAASANPKASGVSIDEAIEIDDSEGDSESEDEILCWNEEPKTRARGSLGAARGTTGTPLRLKVAHRPGTSGMGSRGSPARHTKSEKRNARHGALRMGGGEPRVQANSRPHDVGPLRSWSSRRTSSVARLPDARKNEAKNRGETSAAKRASQDVICIDDSSDDDDNNQEVPASSSWESKMPAKSVASARSLGAVNSRGRSIQGASRIDLLSSSDDGEDETEKSRMLRRDFSGKRDHAHRSVRYRDTGTHDDDDDDRKLPAREDRHMGSGVDTVPGRRQEGRLPSRRSGKSSPGSYSISTAKLSSDASSGSDDDTSTNSDFLSRAVRPAYGGVARAPSLHEEECPQVENTAHGPEPEIDLFKKSGPEPYSLEEFEKLWKALESIQRVSFREIEKSKSVRKPSQEKSEQYGRILPSGMDVVFRQMGLRQGSTYLDIGHGIGNTCLQAAYTYQCKAKGIECDEGRNNVACLLKMSLEEDLYGLHKTRDNALFRPGKVKFLHGYLQDEEHRDFLTKDVDFAFCNNFDGVFNGERDGIALTKGERHLDDSIAASFALMKEGATLVTLHSLGGPLRCSPLSASKARRRLHGLPESESNSSSFYEFTKFSLGEQRDVASWSEGGGCRRELYGYMYTRVNQSAGNGSRAVFMCNNAECENAKKGIVMDAVQFDEKGPYIATCVCRQDSKTKRERKGVDRYGEYHP